MYKPEYKNPWDKAEVILKPLAGIATAVVVAMLGFWSKDYFEARDKEARRQQSYVQIVTQREESESQLRTSMFNMIIQSFLKQEDTDLDEKILNLELLCYNFHENFNVKPLFGYLNREVAKGGAPNSAEYTGYRERLSKLAREIVRRQVAVLDQGGEALHARVRFPDGAILLKEPHEDPLVDDGWHGTHVDTLVAPCQVGEIEHKITLTVDSVDVVNEEIRFSLIVGPPDPVAVVNPDELTLEEPVVAAPLGELSDLDTRGMPRYASATFWVGYYDFPMTDNLRLRNDQRCAITVSKFYKNEGYADITVICFPGAYASRRDKPYFEEMMNQMLGNDTRSIGSSEQSGKGS